MTHRHFYRGSSTYICVGCGKRTRDTLGIVGTRYCARCIIEQETENAHVDGAHEKHPDPSCPLCQAGE